MPPARPSGHSTAAVVSVQPLHTCSLDPFYHLSRAHSGLYALALVTLFYRHATNLLFSPTLPAILLFVADFVLAFQWTLLQAFRWRPLRRHAFPDRLAAQRPASSLPALDVFIFTADPVKEPPIGVVCTALSVMAFDYPTEKLSVYVSDDGGSDLTLFACMEAARFARYWIPFCRENMLMERSPEAYFGSSDGHVSSEGLTKIKVMYQRMKEKVELVVERGYVDNDLLNSQDKFQVFKRGKTGRFIAKDQPSIIEVLLECIKDTDITDRPLPNLVYVSREKSRSTPHNFKAGAQNALLRVSSTMTNAPVVLTLDCDMASNDPESPLRALCYLLDESMKEQLAFVQFPQRFAGINQDDIYGCELKRLFFLNPLGMDGQQGTAFVGTGAFFSRGALHGRLPYERADGGGASTPSIGRKEVLDKALVLSGCRFEDSTKWGSTVGFRYGSLVEDFYSGYRLHCEGWRTVFCNPARPAFLGGAPTNLQDTLVQVKRWCVGLSEVAFSPHCPLTYGVKRASLLVGMCYGYYAFWGIWCIPVFVYGAVPAVAMLYGIPLFPAPGDPWLLLYLYLFLGAYAHDLSDFVREGGTFRRWWNDQRMWLIRSVTSFPFGLAEFALKRLGLANHLGFDVTSKIVDEEQSKRYRRGVFEVGPSSPFLTSMATFSLLDLVCFISGLLRACRASGSTNVGQSLAAQLLLSGFVVVNSWPLYVDMVVDLLWEKGRRVRKSFGSAIWHSALVCLVGYLIFRH